MGAEPKPPVSALIQARPWCHTGQLLKPGQPGRMSTASHPAGRTDQLSPLQQAEAPGTSRRLLTASQGHLNLMGCVKGLQRRWRTGGRGERAWACAGGAGMAGRGVGAVGVDGVGVGLAPPAQISGVRTLPDQKLTRCQAGWSQVREMQWGRPYSWLFLTLGSKHSWLLVHSLESLLPEAAAYLGPAGAQTPAAHGGGLAWGPSSVRHRCG